MRVLLKAIGAPKGDKQLDLSELLTIGCLPARSSALVCHPCSSSWPVPFVSCRFHPHEPLNVKTECDGGAIWGR